MSWMTSYKLQNHLIFFGVNCLFMNVAHLSIRCLGPVSSIFKSSLYIMDIRPLTMTCTAFFFEKSLISLLKMVSSVQLLSRVRLFATPWIAACQASLFITNSQSSLRLMSIESVMPSSHLILCRPLLLLPPIPPSIRVLSNESTLRLKWPKYWSFSFSIRWLVTGYKYVYLCWLLTYYMLFAPLCVCVCVCVYVEWGE